jgi:hypothetical protein
MNEDKFDFIANKVKEVEKLDGLIHTLMIDLNRIEEMSTRACFSIKLVVSSIHDDLEISLSEGNVTGNKDVLNVIRSIIVNKVSALRSEVRKIKAEIETGVFSFCRICGGNTTK